MGIPSPGKVDLRGSREDSLSYLLSSQNSEGQEINLSGFRCSTWLLAVARPSRQFRLLKPF